MVKGGQQVGNRYKKGGKIGREGVARWYGKGIEGVKNGYAISREELIIGGEDA